MPNENVLLLGASGAFSFAPQMFLLQVDGIAACVLHFKNLAIMSLLTTAAVGKSCIFLSATKKEWKFMEEMQSTIAYVTRR